MSTARAEGCDGAFWQLIRKETKDQISNEICTTIYRLEEQKIKPNEDHGFYKYDILMIQEDPIKTAEILTAYIGDVDHFITNQARSGIVGLMVKKGCIPKRSVKKMFNLILNNMEFPKKNIKSLLSKVK